MGARRRRGLFALLSTLAAFAGGVVSGQPPAGDEVEQRLAAAQRLLDAGEPAAAAAAYRRLAGEMPRLAEARHGLARALAAQGERHEAAALLLALAAGSAGATAVDYAAEAVALAPESGAVQLALGRAQMLDQRWTAARESLTRAAASPDAGGTAHLLLGLAQWECGDLAAARAGLERAVDLSGRSRAAVQQLGRLHLWAGRPELALPLLREAAAPPETADRLVDLAQALERVGEPAAALAASERAVRLAPDSEAARYVHARLLRRSGDPAAAREELDAYQSLVATRTATQAEAALLRARLDHGWNLLAAGRDDEAAAHFAALPVAAESLAGLARALARLGDAAGAVAALERAVGLVPDRPDLQLLLAEARREAAGEAP